GPEIAHDGQIVALVVAETYEAAREAHYKLKIDYVSEQPSASFGAPGASEEDASKASARAKELPQAGDAEGAFSSAEVKLDVEYATPTQHHNAMELFTTTCAWTDGQLTVHEPSQFMYGLKNATAQRLGISPDKVRAVSRFVGGAFGSKAQQTPRTALVALAAKRLNRPVKLVPTRDQGFTIATYRAETKHHIRMGAQRDGKIASFIHEGFEVTSRPDPYCVAGVEDSARMYGYGAVKTHVTIVHADRNTPGFMRSPPVVPYIYALETAMKIISFALLFFALAAALSGADVETLSEGRLKELVARQQELFADAAKNKDSPAFDQENFKAQLQQLANAYELLLSQSPDFTEAHVAYGQMLWKIEMRNEAIAHLLRANELDSDIPLVKNLLGNYLAEEGRPLEALPYFMAAIKLAPKEPLYHYNLGKLLS